MLSKDTHNIPVLAFTTVRIEEESIDTRISGMHTECAHVKQRAVSRMGIGTALYRTLLEIGIIIECGQWKRKYTP